MGRDHDLVEGSLRGDEEAFSALYERHVDRLRRAIERRMPARLRKRISVSDVLQETYLTAFQRLSARRGPEAGAFGAWLGGIARFKLKEAARHHLDTDKRAAGREISRHRRAESRLLPDREHTPSRHAMAAETAKLVDKAIAGLPRDYRQVLELVHRGGLSTAEAAERMDRSAEAVRKLYGRAVSKLALALERRDG